MRQPYSKDWSRTHRCGELSSESVGEHVVLNGWVRKRRDLGNLIFIELRDRSGYVQVVCDPSRNEAVAEEAKTFRSECVIGVKGEVLARTEENINPDMPSGAIEVAATDITLFSEAQTTPFEIRDDTNAGEDLRLKYRYLDLRRPVLQNSLMMRHMAALAVRNFLSEEGFVEVETPILTAATPEGARDYLVPNRNFPGTFYALPQSPQLFKQLLMVSGMDRYFQIARCFRDEDFRADRQPEFTQIDMELSFVEPDDIYDIVERMLAGLFSVIGKSVQTPFPQLTYQQAMDRYGSDKPDLRNPLEINDVSAIVKDSEFKVFSGTVASGGVVKALTVPGGAGLSRKQIDEAEAVAKTYGAKGLAWIKQDNDGSASGPIVKFLGSETCSRIFDLIEAEPGDAVLFVADTWRTACTALGAVRTHVARLNTLIDDNALKFLWVVDYPLFEEDDEGNPDPMHHPFTSPHPEDLEKLESDPLNVRSLAYDCVLNGFEIGGGSIRIHDATIQQRVFKTLGIEEDEAREKFGFLLEALSFGAPPHGGIAFGLDRIVMLMTGQEAIRSVIAFPKTTSGMDLMTKAPSRADDKQLEELGIIIHSGGSQATDEHN